MILLTIILFIIIGFQGACIHDLRKSYREIKTEIDFVKFEIKYYTKIEKEEGGKD